MLIRHPDLFDAKLSLSFMRDREIAVSAELPDTYWSNWQKNAIKNVSRFKLYETTSADKITEIEDKIIGIRKNIIIQNCKKTKTNNHTVVKFIIIKELIEDFCENILFYEKQDLIRILIKKTLEAPQCVLLIDQKDMFLDCYQAYDQFIPELEGGILQRDLCALTNISLNQTVLIEETMLYMEEEINDVMNDYINKLKNKIAESTITNVNYFVLVLESWLSSFQIFVTDIIDKIKLINNSSYTDPLYIFKEVNKIEINLVEKINAFVPEKITRTNWSKLKTDLTALLTKTTTKRDKNQILGFLNKLDTENIGDENKKEKLIHFISEIYSSIMREPLGPPNMFGNGSNLAKDLRWFCKEYLLFDPFDTLCEEEHYPSFLSCFGKH